MKNSRTSTNRNVKKVTNTTKKVSASPTSANKKKIVKKAPQKTTTKKNVQNNKTIKKQTVNQPKRQVKMVKKDNRNPQNNIRLKKNEEDIDFVPFFSNDEEYVEEIVPNRIRKVEPEIIENIDYEEEKKKVKKRAIAIVKFSFLLAIIIGIGYLMFTLEVFNLKEIKVKGNDKYTGQEIINKTKLKIGENVFKQLLFTDKSLDLSYVSSSKYSYEVPNVITIVVKERYPAYLALDKNSKKYYKLDNEGYILEESNLQNATDVLLIEGLAFENNVKFGEQIDQVYIKKLETYNKIKKLLEKYEIAGEVTMVNFANSLTTVVLDDKLKITFADDSNLEYKVSFLKGIIQKNGGNVEGRIDMSIENPVYSKYD